jgi:hypothetical protein
MGGSGAVTQDGKKKKKKKRGHERPPSAAPVIAAATGGRNERNKRPRPQGGNSGSCPVHPNSRHSAAECHEIIKLVKRVSERREQTFKDGSPPRRRPGKERVDDGDVAAGERDLRYHSLEQVLKDILTRDSDFGDDTDSRKKLYVMYGGSWELTSRRNVKSLRREVLSATPGVLKAAPHQRWRSTTISFGASDCPENMVGANIPPLITAPVIANIKLHHVLIDGGARLNVISHAAFRQLQIPGSRLGPSHPFSGVCAQPVYPLGSITLPVTFGTEENFAQRTSSSMLRRLTFCSMPSLAGRPCTGSWPLPITGIGPQDAVPSRGPHRAWRPCRCTCGCREAARPDGRNCSPGRWREGPLELRHQGVHQSAKGAAIRGGRRPRQGHPALREFPPDHSHCG